MKFNKKSIGLIIVGIIVLMQFIRPSHAVPETDPNADFITIFQPSEEISGILKNACYDCHSHNSKYPWYSNIAPVSYWLSNHINEGREELNFSVWETYSLKRKNHKLEEIAEMVEEKEMPLNSYTWMHEEAKLTDEQRSKLAAFAKSLMQEEKE